MAQGPGSRRSPILRRLLENPECHPQQQSVLYQIPPEIRLIIFRYALSEQNGATAISEIMSLWRPDYTHYQYINTSLLLTCRILWAEAQDIPRQQILERTGLGCSDALTRKGRTYDLNRRAELPYKTPPHVDILPCETIQVFYPLSILHAWPTLLTIGKLGDRLVPVRKLILTNRYGDWPQGGWDEDYFLPPAFLSDTVFPESFEKIVIELETALEMKDKIEALVAQYACHWTFRTAHGRVLEYQPTRTQRTEYLAADRPGGRCSDDRCAPQHFGHDLRYAELQIEYYLIELNFSA